MASHITIVHKAGIPTRAIIDVLEGEVFISGSSTFIKIAPMMSCNGKNATMDARNALCLDSGAFFWFAPETHVQVVIATLTLTNK